MARPTKYTVELGVTARSYICNYHLHKHVIPSVRGMAKVLNVAESTLYDWASNKSNEFSEILGECKSEQAFALIEKGLTSDFNSNIVKLMLTKHGYSDKQETKVEGNIGLTDLTDEELDRKLQLLEQANEQSTKT